MGLKGDQTGTWRPSPNFDDRRGLVPDMLVVHYTGMETAEAALDRLTDPEAKVSAHWLIEENGQLWNLVAPENRAWHAGLAHWRGEHDINARSLGIELVNPGHEFGYRPFPQAQLDCLISLVVPLIERYAIESRNILGHSDVAPARKQDPGELFPWQVLAEQGVGWLPGSAEPADVDDDLARRALGRIGYGLEGVSFEDLVAAFQRRYRQSRVDGKLDAETMGLVLAVSDRFS